MLKYREKVGSRCAKNIVNRVSVNRRIQYMYTVGELYGLDM